MTEQLLQEPSQYEMEEVTLPLQIRGRFLRFKEKLPFAGRKYVKDVAPCSVVLGTKGTGKSSFTENLATHFSDPLKQPSKTGKILDWFGSRDAEGLGWLRSPFDNILFIVGDNTDVSSSWDYKHIKDVKLSDFRNYHVVLTVSPFFSNLRAEHHFIEKAMNMLRHRKSWHRPDALLIREAANLVFSRISLKENQATAKAYTIYTLREARHCGYAVCADAIRFKSVDIDMRSIADFTVIKAVGIHGLPREISFIYKYIEPFSIMRMPVERFILLSGKGTIAVGDFEYPPWHKKPREDLLKEFDIQIEHGSPINYGDKGYKQVSDFEHEKIVTMRKEAGHEGMPLSFDKIATRLKRSSGTTWSEVDKHNSDVRSLGVCTKCERVRCKLAKIEV